MRVIKKADLLLIVILALIPAAMLAYNIVSASSFHEPRLVIMRDGEVYGTFPLSEDRTVEIGDTNICEISGGEVRMVNADCPDQVCVHTRAINKFGGTIVCLPNKIVLTIEEAQDNPDEDAPDAVTS